MNGKPSNEEAKSGPKPDEKQPTPIIPPDDNGRKVVKYKVDYEVERSGLTGLDRW